MIHKQEYTDCYAAKENTVHTGVGGPNEERDEADDQRNEDAIEAFTGGKNMAAKYK